MIAWLIAVFVALVALFYALSGDGSALEGLSTTERWVMIGGLGLMGLFAFTLLSDYAGRIGTGIKHFAIWVGIGAALVAGYSMREELAYVGNRMAGELLPPGSGVTTTDPQTGETAVRIRQRTDGQFVARTRVNAAAITMLVDTGASTVVLKPADARSAGINTDQLSFTVPVRTANGTTFAAPVRIKRLAIGPIVVDDIEALVSKPGNLNVSLLGMTFLRRLSSYEFSGSFLTLRG